AVALQRTGQMGTYPSCLGQEAIGTGIGFAMQDSDVFIPYYRDHATQMLRGVSIREILLYWGGDERGSQFQDPRARQDFPVCVPIATQITHAAGVAASFKVKKEHRAALVTCGDGATSRGDFYESLNAAGAWQLPLVVVVNNNQWAISVPRKLQTAAETIAQKAIAAGVPGEQVDGNDVIAVYDAVLRALTRAHSGKGPTLIEAISYRLSDHTTADDATRYRSNEELNKGWEKEPIKRLRDFLHQQNLWNEAKEIELQQRCQAKVQQGVAEYLAEPPQAVTAMFDYLYEKLPAAYLAQRESLVAKTRGAQ
ncbi:MAG TPA: pyruvate dehydrogenase (acetyl-transferring) E1 component subunit alpha, partial [Pseudomonadales bacterium]|nr:pyruvate dehydrogenase (acetyl-transferring) E1 component subunit alpha [Pseudomonadales bacterium]